MLTVLFDQYVALPGATITDLSGPGSDGNEGVLRIP